MIPSLSKYDLEYVVEFLYSGQISCSDQDTVSQVLSNLSKLLGFPESMDFSSVPNEDQRKMNHTNYVYDTTDGCIEDDTLGVGVKVEFETEENDDNSETMNTEISSRSPQKLSRPHDFDETKVTWGPGVCPICEKVGEKILLYMLLQYVSRDIW